MEEVEEVKDEQEVVEEEEMVEGKMEYENTPHYYLIKNKIFVKFSVVLNIKTNTN